MRKTKIVFTMGPSLEGDAELTQVLEIADAVRINASHNTTQERTETLKRVRKIALALGRRIPVFLDLQGPKWRIGLMDAPVQLEVGAIGALFASGDAAPTGLAWAAPMPHLELFRGAKVGQKWLLDDGALELEITEVKDRKVLAKVLVGGLLKQRKGVHPIGLDVAFDPLTPKDLEDVRWGVEQGVDLFAQSFVRRVSDLEALQNLIQSLGGSQPIIAKIEHPQALDNLEEILKECWGVMVARGDLGVELGVEKVPALQKRIIRKARMALKPVITATQMLESMIENPQPTRAEASDVANAIWDGTDAVMLSAESAAGKYPVAAVQWLDRIAADADEHFRPRQGRFTDALEDEVYRRTDVSVAFAACRTAEEIGAKVIVVFTEGGGVARMVSRLAGNIPVIGATTELANARRMGLMRGVTSKLIPRVNSSDELVDSVEHFLIDHHDVAAGDKVVMTMGLPIGTSGTTNTMKVIKY